MVAPGKGSHEMLGTFEELKKQGHVPQPRKIDAEDLSLS